MIAPGGAIANFGSIVPGAAYIEFVMPPHPYAWNFMPTMYVADGGANIYRIAPAPPSPAQPTSWGAIKALFQ